MEVTIGLADDHKLFVRSLGALIDRFKNYRVVLEAFDGQDLLDKLNIAKTKPDILLVDVRMPGMGGVEAAKVVSEKHPEIKMSALSDQEDDTTIINMIKAGCCAYLLKGIDTAELEKALEEISEKGYYNGDVFNINFRRFIKKAQEEEALSLPKNEKTFLKLASSDLTYKHIAAKMNLSERTIDGYRESLFKKFNVQSRVGMVLEAIRRNIVSIEKC